MAVVAVSVISLVAFNFLWTILADAGGCQIERIFGPTYTPLRALLSNTSGNATSMDLFYSEVNRTVYIRGARDARLGMISLAGSSEEEFEMMYEIALGAGNNTYSSIRRGKPGSMMDKNFTRTLGILDNNEWKGFWIFHNQTGGVIQVASLEDSEYPIMGWLDLEPLRVSTHWHVASWLKNMSLEISLNCDPNVYGEVFVEELTSQSSSLSSLSNWSTLGIIFTVVAARAWNR